MNDVTKVNSNALMTGDLAARLMRGIAESRSTTVIVGGKPSCCVCCVTAGGSTVRPTMRLRKAHAGPSIR